MASMLGRPAKFGGGLGAAAQPGAEQRRERRYKVDLPGEAQVGGAVWPVLVSDLSASGALLTVAGADVNWEVGSHLLVVLHEYGTIKACVAHVGSDFCGVQFLEPHLHRDLLNAWLRSTASAR